MKLSKKEEKELLQVYETWWESYLGGDIETYNSYFTDDFRFVGSTDGEEFLNRADTVAFLKATADQLAGKAKLENINRSIETLNGTVLITDLADAYILSDQGWVYYGRFRFTSLLRSTPEGWRFFYQHFSTPDLKAQEGETLGLEKVTAENLELRTAIKRRTAELELKNRELDIEASLERVRSRTMMMQSSEELKEVIQVVYDQFVHLNIPVDHTGFILDYKNRDDMYIWLADSLNIPTQLTIPYFDSPHWNDFIEAQKNGKDLFVNHFSFEEKNEFYKKLFSYFPEIPKENKETYFSYPSLDISTVLLDHVSLYMENFSGTAYTDEENKILMRFGQVFQQTYTRFLDLQKAEAQAREAQIEAALERVRSRTMAMHKSDELSEVASLLFQQIKDLGIRVWTAGFNVWKNNDNAYEDWITSPQGGFIEPYIVDTTQFPVFMEVREAKQRGDDFFVQYVGGETIKAMYAQLSKFAPKQFEIMLRDGFEFPKHQYDHFVFGSSVSLMFITFEPLPEAHEIFKRFGKVFEQTYTRFLDLQKAEEQAREAQIEAALERVRSRSMAMHSAEELADTAMMLFDQVKELGIVPRSCGFLIMDEEKQTMEDWSANIDERGKAVIVTGTLSFDQHPILSDVVSTWRKGEPYIIAEVHGEDLQKYYQAVTSKESTSKTVKKKVLAKATSEFTNSFYFEYGMMYILTPESISEDEINILMRFAGVFKMTYRRFLDIQKAEAQAREAQIEAALERVRSKTMAMHNSQDVGATVGAMFDELVKLGIDKSVRCGIGILDPVKTVELWTASSNKDGEVVLNIGYLDTSIHPLLQGVRKAWKNKERSFTYELKGKDLIQYFNALNESPEYTFHVDLESLPKKVVHNSFPFSEGSLFAFSPQPLTDEEDQIFKRFSGVFGQTYTRYLDLLKAEAQAREAQIEAALEKVRSRSLAMHSTEELQDVVQVVAEKLTELGVILDVGGAVICTYFPDSKDVMHWTASFDPAHPSVPYYLPYFDSPIFNDAWASKNSGEPTFEKVFSFEDKNDFFNKAFELSDYKNLPEQYKKEILEAPDHGLFFAWSKNSALMIPTHSGLVLQQEHKSILKRFATVFEQAYIRFLDLQKAEAQAREAQIEAALEKVRSRTMAMQHSEELLEVASVLFHQVKSLGVPQWNCGFNIWKDGDEEFTYYPGSPDGEIIPFSCKIPLNEHPVFRRFDESRKKGEALLIYEKEGEEQKEHYKYMLSLPGVGDFLRSMMDADFELPAFQVDHLANFAYGNLIFITYEHFPEMHNVFIRFAKVFEQTYTRFLDLQKAEKQSREAQIEAALERVRSKTMAMHNSEDVGITVKTLFDEVMNLGMDKSIRCGIGILENGDLMETWSANLQANGEVILKVGLLNMDIHPMLRSVKRSWSEGEKFSSYVLKGEDVYRYYKALNQEPDYEFDADLTDLPEKQFNNSFYFSFGVLFAFTENPLSDESSMILGKFAEVFSQTYRRYLDLKKAEEQAREAQIEAALERVRSRTMAMQSSDELQDAANLLFLEIQALGIHAWSCGYNIVAADKKSSVCWMSSEGELQDPFPLYFTKEKSFREMGAFLKSDSDFFVQELDGKALEKHYAYMKSLPELKHTFQHIEDAGLSLPTYQINHLCKFSQGFLLFITYEKVPEGHDIFKRFTRVFEQTYTRFLDLQKAEAQARESSIEASLERVRGKAMAMHNSNDLDETVLVFGKEMIGLSQVPIVRIGACLLSKDNKVGMITTITKKSDGSLAEVKGQIDMKANSLSRNTYKNWLKQEEYHHVLKGNELSDYYRTTGVQLNIPEYPPDTVQYFYFPMFKEGSFYVVTENQLSEKEMEVFRRFTSVLSLTYKRYKDLKDAENRARLAVQEASLDRVRAEIASMRTSEDLKRITPLLWRELLALDVPFFRCGVMIIDEKKEKVQFYLSTPDGKPLAAMNLDFEANNVTQNGVSHWRSQTVYKDHWDKQQFLTFMKKLMEDGKIQTQEAYQGGEQPPESLTLQFVPFPQGMLYIGSDDPLTEDQIELAKALADAFSVAYARYEDFTKLEAAKVQVEKALAELQSTQKQLVQSEKMASLGELTAGIAHEIQNPLNFVNNFAEVSTELVDEMNEEMDNGELSIAKEISGDLKQNLEKIAHHGKRAGAIVKGMLQHSRTSSGVKELTDINVLADEYLRLAFHGLRAKNKSFNARMETDFDDSLEKINVIPQDIGRVLLNMITNAFYAANERKNVEGDDFEPAVMVATKMKDQWVEITVRDNGTGIPQEVLDKIFQPFFTTKPTGQGTGLGLSLSYDIVKAHGGTFHVDTELNKGTSFVVKLPA